MQDKHLQWKRVQVLVLGSDSVRKEVEDEPALKKGNDDTWHAVAPLVTAVCRFCNGQRIHMLDLLNQKIVGMLELGHIHPRSISFQPHGVLIDRHSVIPLVFQAPDYPWNIVPGEERWQSGFKLIMYQFSGRRKRAP